MHKKSTKRLAVVLSVVGVLGLAVAAYAYWSANGSGSASGTNASGNAAVSVITNDSLDGLYPGKSIDFSGTFSNPNGNPVKLTNLSATLSVTPAAGNTCDTDNYDLSPMTIDDGDVQANSQGGAFHGTLAMKTLPSNQDGCKSAVVKVTYSVS
jgi:hypothetical protein